MVPVIRKINVDGIEYLPDIIQTPLWRAIDPDSGSCATPRARQLAGLYAAISKRENYFQDNLPTAFGNPDYSFCCGVVHGLLQALNAEETVEDGKIVVRSCGNNHLLLIIDKLTRPADYHERLKENREVLSSLGV